MQSHDPLSTSLINESIQAKIQHDIALIKSKLVALERHARLQEEHQQFTALLNHIVQAQTDDNCLSKQLDELITKINDTVAPLQVSVSNKLYNQTINRICYRGDDRPPFTETGEGIFSLGFSKTKVSKEYQQWVKQFYYEGNLTSDIRVRKPLAINRASTIPTSRDPKSAAFFPIAFKLTKLTRNDVCTLLQDYLSKLNQPAINIDTEYCALAGIESDTQQRVILQSNVYCEAQKKLLISILIKHLGESYYDQIDNLLLKVQAELFARAGIKDTSWIYVVCVGTGFDVSGHGYLYASANQFRNKEHNVFYAQEICTDEIPSERVIAAIEIERDFTNMRITREYMRELENFHGEANFTVKNITYNPHALDYFKNQHDIDVDRYKKLLDEYFEQKIFPINLTKDGYHLNPGIS